MKEIQEDEVPSSSTLGPVSSSFSLTEGEQETIVLASDDVIHAVDT